MEGMKIAVIGAGGVGGGLGLAWARVGHDVTFGVPDAKMRPARDKIGGQAGRLAVATPAAAAESADAIVLAVPWPAAQEAVASLGDVNGKLLVDVTNPLLPDFSWLDDSWLDEQFPSGAERIASWATGAHVFKAFNQTGAENLSDPSRYTRKPVMFAAGDDVGAEKSKVLRLIADAGFESVYAGPLRVARLLEAYGMLWIHLALQQGLGRAFAFSIERLDASSETE